MRLLRNALLLALLHLAALAWILAPRAQAQPSGAPTSQALNVDKATGAITPSGNITSTTFAQNNNLARGNGNATITGTGTLTLAGNATVPAGTITLVDTASSQTLTNKNLAGGTQLGTQQLGNSTTAGNVSTGTITGTPATWAGNASLDGRLIATGNATITLNRAVGYTAPVMDRLPRLYNKLASIGLGTTGSGGLATWFVGGDSLAIMIPQHVLPVLRRQYGAAGFIGVARTATGGGTPTGGTLATYNYAIDGAQGQSSYDYTISPTGEYTTISGSGHICRITMGNLSAAGYPFSADGIEPNYATAAGALTCDRLYLAYRTKSGGGTFKLQVSADASTWTDVTGYTSVSSNSATGTAVITATITAQKVTGIQAVWLSGGTVEVLTGGAWGSAATGIITVDLSRGGMEMTDFNTSPATAPIIAALPTVDLVSLWCGDNDIDSSLSGFPALFTNSPDFVLCGTIQGQTDAMTGKLIYNDKIRAKALSLTDTIHPDGAVYVDTLARFRDWTTANARGYMADSAHPNQLGSGVLAAGFMRDVGLDTLLWGREWRNLRSELASVGTLSTNTITAVSGNLTLTGAGSGPSLVLGNGTNAGMTLTSTGNGTITLQGGSSASGVKLLRVLNAAGGQVMSANADGRSVFGGGNGNINTILSIDNLGANTTAQLLAVYDGTQSIVWNDGRSMKTSSASGLQIGNNANGAAFQIGGTAPNDSLVLSSAGAALGRPAGLKNYIVSGLPSASTSGAGAMAFVTDANATTRLSPVAGGGSNKVIVFSDGSNWLIQ